ncbi:polyketide biosynthesis methyltransferase [Amycolatopsis sp. RM579]|uniref:Polyketide biosynthesis methyltransferase n=2 Tax=Amycolatopsis pithecellobii TaxID=664692 RepID=A0A6N7Z7I1_9PSEU|nr:polyketide biosynthesis methyltransferase [Amycolatopsis pithecellobii]
MSEDEARRLFQASTDKPHEGRIYDWYLGGNSNYAVDRDFADAQIRLLPDIPWAARQNRGYLARAVQYMINEGVRQFIDIGSGLPTQGNVHQLAERFAPGECHVIYADHDPVASAHAYLLLEQSGQLERNVPINGDFLRYEELWTAIRETGLIDLGRPVGLLLVALLHFVPDDAAADQAVRYFRELLPSGSCLAISHASTEHMSVDAKARLENVLKNYDAATSKARTRTRAQVRDFFGDWELADPPGLVWTPEWTMPGLEQESLVGEMDASRSQAIAGLARKP